jgi:hypothetical protein
VELSHANAKRDVSTSTSIASKQPAPRTEMRPDASGRVFVRSAYYVAFEKNCCNKKQNWRLTHQTINIPIAHVIPYALSTVADNNMQPPDSSLDKKHGWELLINTLGSHHKPQNYVKWVSAFVKTIQNTVWTP